MYSIGALAALRVFVGDDAVCFLGVVVTLALDWLRLARVVAGSGAGLEVGFAAGFLGDGARTLVLAADGF